jgi:hypothetical protein
MKQSHPKKTNQQQQQQQQQSSSNRNIEVKNRTVNNQKMYFRGLRKNN